jgi:hypothetical protein
MIDASRRGVERGVLSPGGEKEPSRLAPLRCPGGDEVGASLHSSPARATSPRVIDVDALFPNPLEDLDDREQVLARMRGDSDWNVNMTLRRLEREHGLRSAEGR